MPKMRTALGALMLAGALLTSACATGDDAVIAGPETFEFVSPDGQLEIFYDPPAERKPVAEIAGPDLLDPDTTLNLQQDHAGEVVVLNTWGQWCGPCRAEVDDLQDAHETLEPLGGSVLGINVRDYQPEIAQDFVVDNGVSYPSIYDPPFRTAVALGGVPTSVIPTTVVLDREHRPAAVFLREVTADDILEVALPLTEET